MGSSYSSRPMPWRRSMNEEEWMKSSDEKQAAFSVSGISSTKCAIRTCTKALLNSQVSGWKCQEHREEPDWAVICSGVSTFIYGPFGTLQLADDWLDRHCLDKSDIWGGAYCKNNIEMDDHHTLILKKGEEDVLAK